MKITAKKINDTIVKTVPVDKSCVDKRPILGYNMFPEMYSNIFLCAKKKSGKSTVIYNILKHCTGKYTKIIAFVSTLHKDDTWRKIEALCKKNNVYFEGHTAFKEDGVDRLAELINQLNNEYPEEQVEKGKKKKNPVIILDDDSEDEDEEKAKKKMKYQAPEYIFVLDDLSTELRNPNLESFLKKNRHYKSKVIISNQYLNNIAPQSRKQFDYWLVFKGQPKHKLEEIYGDSDASIGLDRFQDLYKNATENKYNFLYIDSVDGTFRKNFNVEYNIPEIDHID